MTKIQCICAILIFLFSIDSNGQCDCDPIVDTNDLQITVSNVSQLEAALDQAHANNGSTTILLEAGTYTLNSNLRFISDNMSHLTVMGITGNRDEVIIQGLGWNDNSVTHIFNVAADNFTIANMTIGSVYYHPIQVHSNPNDADNFLAQNVRFIDAKEQLLKVSGGGDLLADNGIIQCCSFEFTNGIAYQYYTGGIDAHRSKDWIVRYNFFNGIRSPESQLAEHAIHFWRESEGTQVEANEIRNCDRGIGFGLGDNAESGHQGGIILNNFVHTNRDVGIGLERSPDTKIYNNTVITENYNRSIEYRFSATQNVQIYNNIVDQEISDRSSGSNATLMTNYTVDDVSIFEDYTQFNFHIKETAFDVIDAGTPFESMLMDVDCNSRSMGLGVDIGADEFDQMTSTEEIQKTLKIFPNPTSQNINLKGLDGSDRIQLINCFGQICGSVQVDSEEHKWNINHLPNGVYFLIATKNNGTVLHKARFIKY